MRQLKLDMIWVHAFYKSVVQPTYSIKKTLVFKVLSLATSQPLKNENKIEGQVRLVSRFPRRYLG